MKKLILLSCFVALAGYAFAQEDEGRQVNKPEAGTFGVMWGLENIFQNNSPRFFSTSPGNTGTLLFRYYVADAIALRAGVSYSSWREKDVSDVTMVGNSERQTTEIERMSEWRINLGVEKHFANDSRFDPYIGLDAYFGGESGFSDVRTEYISGDLRGDFTQTEQDYASDFLFGVNGILGVQYFLTSNFALGAEFAYGFRMVSVSPGETTVTTRAGGTTTTDVSESHADTGTVTSGLGTTGSGAITVSFFF